MGRNPKRKFRKYVRGKIEVDLSLGSLAASVVIGENFANTVTETTWCTSVKSSYALSNYTQNAGDGPVTVGIAHSDYTDSEIEEWVELVGGWDVGNLVAQEINKRKIRQVGVFDAPLTTADISRLADGRMIRTKCGWMLNSGDTLKVWCFNQGASALTSGGVVHLSGHANLWPTD